MTSTKTIRFEFDDFGRSMLEVAARRTGLTVGELLCQAAHRSVYGPARPMPTLRRLGPGGSRGDVAATLELRTGDWRALEAEAKRRNVRVEQVLEEAALRLVADLDGSPRPIASV